MASYATYDEAQAAIDGLAAVDFPIEELEIVGSGLRSVERVTGRMTLSRTLLSGAAGGSWVGLFVGLVVGLFSGGAVWVGLLAGGFLIGAVWGATLAAGLRWVNRGRHSFSSLRSVVATQYDLIGLDGVTDRARSALEPLAAQQRAAAGAATPTRQETRRP